MLYKYIYIYNIILVRLLTTIASDGITIKVIIENIIWVKHVCNNIYLIIFVTVTIQIF